MMYLMILCMNDISLLMIVMDIIPNYNYCILYHFRGACLKYKEMFEVCLKYL